MSSYVFLGSKHKDRQKFTVQSVVDDKTYTDVFRRSQLVTNLLQELYVCHRAVIVSTETCLTVLQAPLKLHLCASVCQVLLKSPHQGQYYQPFCQPCVAEVSQQEHLDQCNIGLRWLVLCALLSMYWEACQFDELLKGFNCCRHVLLCLDETLC